MTTEASKPGLEARLRDYAFRSGLGGSGLVVRAYRMFCRIRFVGRWDHPVAFRGSRFVVGRDLSLYPAVHSGAFERVEFDWLLPKVTDDAIVWDVGANVGLYTVLLANRARTGRVVAFEPVASTAQRLAANITLNGVENVVLESLALSDVPGRATMRIYADAPGCNTLVPGPQGEVGVETLEVPVDSADGYAQRSGSWPSVIKVDIEGAEPGFIRGAKTVLGHRKPILIMEVNAAILREDSAKLAEWTEMMTFLFGLYGVATWFDLEGERPVSGLEAADVLELPRAATLAFGG